MEADSCSTANIIDEHKLEKLQSSLKNKIKALHPKDTQLFAFAQKEPIPLAGRFDAEIESISTGEKTMAHFQVAKGATKSRPLLSLDACSSSDPVIAQLTSEYHDVFSGLGKHQHIKAKLIIDEDVHPVHINRDVFLTTWPRKQQRKNSG